MLKNIPLMIVLAASLTACGGSGGGGGKKSSSSVALSSSTPAESSIPASSTPASSEPASSTPASSAPASSSEASSAAPESSSAATSSAASNVINADITTGWRGNGTGNSGVTYIAGGVSFNASAAEIGAVFDVDPVNLQNAVLEIVLNVSPEFKASGANLQPFAQVKEVWGGKWCDIPNSAFNASEDYVATCTLDDAVLNQTVNGYQVGVQASGTSPTGVVTIKSAKITLATQASSSSVASSAPVASSSSSSSSSAASGGINADMTKDWEVGNGGGTIAYTANGVVYTPAAPTQYDSSVYFLPVGPFNLEGATLSVTMIPDAAFKASGKNPQPFAQVAGGSYAGEFDCWFNNADLVVDASNVLTCTISQGGAFNITDTIPVRLGFQVVGGAGTSFAGSVTITAASVVLAQ